MGSSEASSNTRRGLRAFRIVAVVGVVILLVLGVSVGRAWPWMASPPPERVAKAWAVVERAAAEPVSPPSDAPALAAFMDALRAKTIDENDALEKLVVWSRASRGAPTPTNACTQGRPIVALARLSESAFRTSLSAERIEAFVRLAAHLRRAGTLFEHRVGMAILERALRSLPHEERAPAVFRELRANVEELHGALARDAICVDALFAEAGALGSERERVTSEQSPKAPWFARRFVRAERERAMLRLQAGERLAECASSNGDDNDGAAFVECYRRVVERDDVPSVMSRAVAVIPPPIHELLALQREVLAR